MTKETEFTTTGCVDCGIVRAMSKTEPDEKNPSFEFGSSAVKMWKDSDNKHHLIIVQTRPQRVFLSCQPFNKLLTESGVAAILNMVEGITKSMEVDA